MSNTLPPPSCCAGLRQTLLRGWQQDFPLDPSPFRLMAARSGATPRELLSTCQALQRSGALQPIRVRWGPAMRREHWRLAFDPGDDAAALAAALAAQPGCLRIERPDDGAVLALVWAEIEALDTAALQRQLDRLPCPPQARLQLPLPGAEPGVPCDDPRLAACIEQGLRLCTKPFADCARQLGCSEHRVLAQLHAWRRTGQLEGLVLRPTPTRVLQPGVLALWQRLLPPEDVLDRLRSAPGIDRVVVGPGDASWPWRLSLVLRATPQLGLEQLSERVSGLGEAPDLRVPLRISQPREQAMLFQPTLDG